MKEQLAALEKLQQIDTELSGMEVDLKKYPEQIALLENELAKDKDKITEHKNQLQVLQTNKTQLENTLEENNRHIKSTEDRLFEIKTHKEYVALQKEIAETKKSNSDIEDNVLNEMEQVEHLQEQITTLEQEYARKEEEYSAKIDEYTQKLEELKTTYAPIKEKKDKQSSEITKELLVRYERIRSKNGLAMALAVDEKCTGCHLNIPAQLFNEVLKLTKIIQCPNCKRILYTQEVSEEN